MEYYIEYIIFQEFVIDFILLYTTALLLKKKIKFKRIIMAAMVGVLYTVLVFMIEREFLNYFIIKFLVSVLMLTIAHSPHGFLGYIKTIICFYILSILTFGIVIISYYIFKSRLTIILLLATLFAVYLLFKILFFEIRKNNDNADYLREVSIFLNGNKVNLTGYIDTGNELTETLTNRPVIIVKRDSLKPLFDEKTIDEISFAYSNGTEAIMDFLLNKLQNYNFRILKYGTISSKNEYMLCLVPDKIVVKNKDKCFIVDCVIGIHDGLLNDEDNYQALLFKKLLSWEGESFNANEYF
ncbi:sigma-E processing peptidase SpoIIGA [Sedimentibacter sp. zth1]|uniref:sigma-E processing peptidase SpoIIGA n=1 Tax=Sedimentibacter sp. zth1 TaxID=2816908 RepID=UPI001A91AB14|nr:sigma-E processing peptidase SpoIIGA [Sedimentibacter sp. zth1]QSX06037.1 sigma-E processing peptidase SpoIIGA [Sedimentibacter sp. zth1]